MNRKKLGAFGAYFPNLFYISLYTLSLYLSFILVVLSRYFWNCWWEMPLMPLYYQFKGLLKASFWYTSFFLWQMKRGLFALKFWYFIHLLFSNANNSNCLVTFFWEIPSFALIAWERICFPVAIRAQDNIHYTLHEIRSFWFWILERVLYTLLKTDPEY